MTKEHGNEGSRREIYVTKNQTTPIGFPSRRERKERPRKNHYDEDNLETITATAIKRPHRHFSQMRSAQPPEASPEFASTTGLTSVVGGGAAAGCEVCVARG